MILAAALTAHFLMYPAQFVQVGVTVGTGRDEHLILLVPPGGCSAGVQIKSGHYGDLEAATYLLAYSNVCAEVDRRIAEAKAARQH